jgi:GT2 family glycosyltransferase
VSAVAVSAHSVSAVTVTAPSVDVAIVAHDRKAMVFESLPLLLASPLVRRVIVVDNASSDGIAAEGLARFPSVHWLLLDSNDGCIAWNRAAAVAQAPYFLILDDDCTPELDSLAAAVARLDAESDVGLAVFNVIRSETGQSEWAPFDDLDGSRGWHNAIGACLLARLSAFREVGGYKDFFLCFNDLDLVLSLWEAGHRVVYDARWRALHRKLGAGKRRIYYEVRNFSATAIAHFAALPALAVVASFAARALGDVASAADLGAIARGLKDGVVIGARLRRARRGTLPPAVKRLFYANFLFGRRFVRDPARLRWSAV